MELSLKNASAATRVKIAEKLTDIEKNDPCRPDVNWIQFHLYNLLLENDVTREIKDPTERTRGHNAAIADLAKEYPELVIK